MARKSYNPFKMWGSYLGAILGFLLFQFENGWLTSIIQMPNVFLDFKDWLFYNFSFYIWWVIIGFLIGWSIHSLFRKFKRYF